MANGTPCKDFGEAAFNRLKPYRDSLEGFVASHLGCRASEVIFTAGGTEGANLAVKGIVLASPRGRHVVTSPLEHEAVVESIDYLRRFHGATVTVLPVDAEGRIYVATGQSADVFSPKGEFLGSIAGPKGMHGVAIGGKDKKTLYGIVFYGGWGTPSARNRVIAIPLVAQGYTGRAK